MKNHRNIAGQYLLCAVLLVAATNAAAWLLARTPYVRIIDFAMPIGRRHIVPGGGGDAAIGRFMRPIQRASEWILRPYRWAGRDWRLVAIIFVAEIGVGALVAMAVFFLRR